MISLKYWSWEMNKKMNISADFEKLLEDSIKSQIEWYVEEFNELYGSIDREINSDVDKSIADHILNTLTESLDFRNNDNMLIYLAEAIDTIRLTYPDFF